MLLFAEFIEMKRMSYFLFVESFACIQMRMRNFVLIVIHIFGKWSLGLMPFGLKSFGLIQLVTWLNFFKPSVSGIGHLLKVI